ncbi:MAG: tRNA pseudouridine38-40 synthase [Saprospiraceae bacterium]|jgi:tRNA pseudouridine38-40 synthase
MRYVARVEYDGSLFCGWQTQVGVATVQRAVEGAISSVADEAIVVTVAGRTDTNVHASGQVFHFDTDKHREPRNWLRGINTKLTDGVSVVWIAEVAEAFHARFSAMKRSYRYIILNRAVKPSLFDKKVTWDYRSLDHTLMQQAANSLLGKHDFSAYRASSCQSMDPVKLMVSIDIERHNEWVVIDVCATGFLHHMVRNMMGVLCKIGAQEAPVTWAQEVLASKDRTQGGVTAPPFGLYLTHIEYPNEFGLPEPLQSPRFW